MSSRYMCQTNTVVIKPTSTVTNKVNKMESFILQRQKENLINYSTKLSIFSSSIHDF